MTTLKEVSDAGSAALVNRTGGTAHLCWRNSDMPAIEPAPRASASTSALFMSESIEGLNVGAQFLDRLSAE